MPSGRPSDSPDQPPSGTGTPAPDAARRVGRPSNERFRLLFTRNLNRLLDQRPDVPPEPAARAAELARVCAVTPAAARKWLTGAGWPTLEKLLDLAHRYGFAPDDLLAEGPRQVVDLSRLVDAQALRRAELGELAPAPGLAGAGSLQLAIDPAAFGVVGNPGATSLVLVDVTDEALAPDLSAGDRVVVRLDPHWHGDGIYLLQETSTAPTLLRRIRQVDGLYRIDAGHGPTGAAPATFAAFAVDEATALEGAPILRGSPLCLVRALRQRGR
jgi:transcriptional regulator with XRE-family HTH domain